MFASTILSLINSYHGRLHYLSKDYARANRDNKEVYESLDYDLWENQLWREGHLGLNPAEMKKQKKATHKYNIHRWLMCGAIGATTALTAFVMDFTVGRRATKLTHERSVFKRVRY